MQEGFITIVPNRGAIVAKISSQDLKDFYILLSVLERNAVEWSTPFMTERDLDILTRIHGDLRNLRNSGPRIENWCKQNLAFHRFFRERCGNGKLDWLVAEIRQRTFRYRYTAFSINTCEERLKDHEEILAAVRARKARKAGSLMEKHILKTLNTLLESFAHI
jgi:DNA-binding GntR family transcriptional regulator